MTLGAGPSALSHGRLRFCRRIAAERLWVGQEDRGSQDGAGFDDRGT